MDIATPSAELCQFAADRNREPFHSPKNLAIALSVEAAELLKYFQWLTEERSRSLPLEALEAAAVELTDVQVDLLRPAAVPGVDLEGAVLGKRSANERSYPPNGGAISGSPASSAYPR